MKIASLFKRVGLKPEERAVMIGFHSARISWLFTSLVLLAWSIQGTIVSGQLEPQFMVFASSQLVYWCAYLYYRKKFGG